MKNSTYRVFNLNVSTVKKSHATIPAAWALRNCRQETDAFRGAGAEIVLQEDGPDACGRHRHPKLLELTLDALVTPPWILPCEPEDEFDEFLGQRRTTGSSLMMGPFGSYQPPVPTQNGFGSHQKALPALAGEQMAEGGHHGAISMRELRSFDLSSKDCKLVPQDGYLNIFGGVRSEATEGNLEKRADDDV
jgi:hypothetical protein